ncbi:MAG: hypothetical protein ACJAXQ_001713, partial [Parvibaculaceae bacterium]
MSTMNTQGRPTGVGEVGAADRQTFTGNR